MKQTLKENKFKILVSCLATLLPILFGIILWDSLPDVMNTHWGADGVADGSSTKVFAVFGLPLILLAFNLFCILVSFGRLKKIGMNAKIINLTLCIVPIISIMANGVMYMVALNLAVDVKLIVMLSMGVLFIVLGNYVPKAKRNSFFGIRIFWTLHNDENWNKTHRLGGRLMVAAGVLMLVAAFLPMGWAFGVGIGVLLLATFIPIIYSYSIYRKHKKQGIVYRVEPATKKEKTSRIAVIVTVVAIFVGVAVLMFMGDVQIEVGEEHFTVGASFWDKSVVEYNKIDAIEYREDLDIGSRNYGYGSAKLSLGLFENEEFGRYTIYVYNGNDAVIVIRSGEDVLVLNCEDAEQTKDLYQQLLTKIE